jgi:HAMP domain-containing protein
MRTPNGSVGSPRLLALGQFLLAALLQESSTTTLAATFRPAFLALQAAASATAAALDATIHPRVALRFAERKVEEAIRGLARAAQALDSGKARGPITTALFPQGINAEVKPTGPAQLELARGVLNRLLAQSTAATLRGAHEPVLRTAIDEMTTQLAARDAATAAYDVAMARELAARADFCRAYDSMAGTIRSLFPKDRTAQGVFFDGPRSRKGSPDADPPAPAVDSPPVV